MLLKIGVVGPNCAFLCLDYCINGICFCLGVQSQDCRAANENPRVT